MSKLQLSFHTKFALKKEDLIKILQAASEELGLEGSLKDLMDRTGLGNKKVVPIKSWAVRSGLIDGKTFSLDGEIVWKHDPQLRSLNTNWLMHFHLSLGDKGLQPAPTQLADWGGWTYFIYDFLPKNRAFTLENLLYEAKSHFDDSKDRLTENYRYLLRAYTEPDALAACHLLTTPHKDKYLSGTPHLPNPHLIGYLLAKLWQRDIGNSLSTNTDTLLNHPIGLPKILGIDPETCQTHLNALEAHGILEQRRTVLPFQVIRRWETPLELLEEAYAAH